MSADRGAAVRLLPGVVVSLFFVGWFAFTAEWRAVWDSLTGVSLPLVAASAAVLFTEFFVRTLRWRVLLAPLRTPSGEPPRLVYTELLKATLIGMSMNVALPFRAGDVARPWLGSRATGLAFAPLVTIAVMERVFDILGLVSVLVIMVLTLPAQGIQHPGGEAAMASAQQAQLIYNLKLYGGLLGAGGAVGMSVLFGLAVYQDAARGLAERGIGLLPGPLGGRVRALYAGLAEGLVAVRSLRRVGLAMVLSLVHWMNGSISIFLLFAAFGMADLSGTTAGSGGGLPFSAACFTTVAIALAAALPQAPGFFGVFHAAAETTLRLWGEAPDPAKAFAILLWGVSFIPIACVGSALFWHGRLSLAQIRAGAPPAA